MTDRNKVVVTGASSGIGGVRLEDVVLITAGGNEVLTTHLV